MTSTEGEVKKLRSPDVSFRSNEWRIHGGGSCALKPAPVTAGMLRKT